MPISDRRRIAGTCLLVLGAVLLTLTQVSPSGATAQTAGEIGDLVWFDDNDNGRVDAEETGVPGVVVELFADENLDGAPDGPRLQSAVSAADGSWRFVGLADGSYAIRLPVENWATDGALRGCVSSAPTTPDASDGVDGDDNGFELPGVGIIGGPVVVSADNLLDGSLDFGCHRPVFDVALAIAAEDTVDLAPGDLLVLELDVANVGTLNAHSLVVRVETDDALLLADPDWEQQKQGGLLRHLAVDVLRPGITASLSLQLEVAGPGPYEVVVTFADVRSTESMPNGDGFEPDDPAMEAVATFSVGGPVPADPAGDDTPPADTATDPTVADPTEPTGPDTAVEAAAIAPEPVDASGDEEAVAAETEPNEVPRQAVSPADVAQPNQDVEPVLALTGAEDRLLVLAALICIVAGSMLLLVERWMAPAVLRQK